MAKNNKKLKIFIDTSFLIRLLDKSDKSHIDAKNFFDYFNNTKADFFLSTIVLSEYLVKGQFEDIPFDLLRVEAFDINSALKTAELFNKLKNVEGQRACIKDDIKILAQALNRKADIILCADNDFEKLAKNTSVEIINILKTNYKTYFNLLL